MNKVLIFLIGFMASGKSTTGKLLAGKLGYEFADLDTLIADHEGVAITEIFASKGEDYFRNLEAEVLEKVLNKSNTVIATGGGTPCFFENMQKMKSAGLTIYLKLSPKLIAGRLVQQNTSRPLMAGLRGAKLDNHIRKLLSGREGWYKQSDITYIADKFNINDLVNQITTHLKGPATEP